MLFNTILSTPNAELKVGYVIPLDLDPLRPFLLNLWRNRGQQSL
jgi:hypothetical protein